MKYLVEIRLTVTTTAAFEIEANSEEDAEKEAKDRAEMDADRLLQYEPGEVEIIHVSEVIHVREDSK